MLFSSGFFPAPYVWTGWDAATITPSTGSRSNPDQRENYDFLPPSVRNPPVRRRESADGPTKHQRQNRSARHSYSADGVLSWIGATFTCSSNRIQNRRNVEFFRTESSGPPPGRQAARAAPRRTTRHVLDPPRARPRRKRIRVAAVLALAIKNFSVDGIHVFETTDSWSGELVPDAQSGDQDATRSFYQRSSDDPVNEHEQAWDLGDEEASHEEPSHEEASHDDGSWGTSETPARSEPPSTKGSKKQTPTLNLTVEASRNQADVPEGDYIWPEFSDKYPDDVFLCTKTKVPTFLRVKAATKRYDFPTKHTSTKLNHRWTCLHARVFFPPDL